jgi:hypothetical protein
MISWMDILTTFLFYHLQPATEVGGPNIVLSTILLIGLEIVAYSQIWFS